MRCSAPFLSRTPLLRSSFGLILLALAGNAFGSGANLPKANPGFSYHHDEVRYVPWSIHVLQIDRSSAGLEIQSMLGQGTKFGLTTLSEQIHLLPPDWGRPIAAINGDFFEKTAPYVGDPKGLQISRGELISAPSDWTCFWVDSAGHPQLGKVTPHFSVTWPTGATTPLGLNERRGADKAVIYTHAVGASTHTKGGRELLLEKPSAGKLPLQIGEDYTMRVEEVHDSGDTSFAPERVVLSISPELLRQVPNVPTGATLRLSTATVPKLKGSSAAVSGGPPLVQNGKILYNASQARHPRSAIGWNNDFIFFVEVDGRQPGVSVGMTYGELAKYMSDLGCVEALNFDGGGSSTLWVLGQVMNNPSEGDERGVANGLVLVQKVKPDEFPPHIAK